MKVTFLILPVLLIVVGCSHIASNVLDVHARGRPDLFGVEMPSHPLPGSINSYSSDDDTLELVAYIVSDVLDWLLAAISLYLAWVLRSEYEKRRLPDDNRNDDDRKEGKADD